MAKTASIIVRVDPAVKQRIEEAATRAGKSLTTFILEAATAAAMKATTEADHTHAATARCEGIPKYFAILCREARNGGTHGYDGPAFHLAIHVHDESPDDVTWEEWQDECARLNELCRAGDDRGVWKWFRRHYPASMKLVPPRRKQQFLKGVYKAFEEERIC